MIQFKIGQKSLLMLNHWKKRWVKVEGWTKEETRKVEAPKLHSRLTKARSSAMWSEQEDLYSRAQREEQVRAEADAAFQRFDVDGNGRISVRELKVALRELGFESSAYNTKALMKKFDDGSGGEAIGSGKLENATLGVAERHAKALETLITYTYPFQQRGVSMS